MGLKRYGGPPQAVAMADQPGAGLPSTCLACAAPAPAANLEDAVLAQVLKVLADKAPPRG